MEKDEFEYDLFVSYRRDPNLALAAMYNLAAVGLCFAGLVTPVIAAILMPLSSVSIVSLTAYRLADRRLEWMS